MYSYEDGMRASGRAVHQARQTCQSNDSAVGVPPPKNAL